MKLGVDALKSFDIIQLSKSQMGSSGLIFFISDL